MRAVLLLVDLQRDFLAAPDLQPPADGVVARAAALLAGCRQRQIPAVHVWTTVCREDDRRLPHWKRADRWRCVAGTEGHQPPAGLQPSASERLIHKSGFNPFLTGELQALFQQEKWDTVILAGLHLHACIRAAAVECLERGLQVHVAEDAIASDDPIHAAGVRRWLGERCVAFEPIASLLALLDGQSGSPLCHRSPRRTAEILFDVRRDGAKEIEDAVATARGAWPVWRRIHRDSCGPVLDRIADRLEAAAPRLARQMALEIGKPVRHGLEEVRRAAANVRDVRRRAGARHSADRETPSPGPAGGFARERPLGTVALISPWNNPVAIPLGKIAPALAYGNVVVWKPAPAATMISEAVFDLLREAGLPAGTVTLVSGDHRTAQGLASHAQVDAITFTGSLAAGRAIQEIAARRIVPLQAELSGNNAAIVWDAPVLERAASQLAWGAFGFAGQRCTANRRVIVHAPLFEPFLAALAAATQRLPWGDPLLEATEIGPVIDTARRDELARLVREAHSGGAVTRVLFPHAATAEAGWVRDGAYAQPVIAACDRPGHVLVQEETMSPLVVVQRAEDFEHALALCNGVRYGLAAALFSDAEELRRRFLDEAEAGLLKLNASTAGADVTLPFGGWKASGIGPPEHGTGDPMFYTRMQAVYGQDG